MTETNVHDAWSAFWERQGRTGGKRSGGCLPETQQSIDRMRAEVWKDFARSLPRNARVLDLATGDGLVMAHMLAARRDLKMTGIDRAAKLPPGPKGAKLKGGVSMEALPFPDTQFAAITSQFGFEYGDTAKVAVEAARVLRSDGRMALMTHRIDGPIVAHNRKRREQIAWAIDDQELLKQAKNSLGLRSAGIAAVPKPILEAPEKGAALHGQNSAAWEIAEAVRRTLHMGHRESPARVAQVIDEIGAQAQNELGRIASLELAAETASDTDTFLSALSGAGLECVEHRELTDGLSPQPYADFRIFQPVS